MTRRHTFPASSLEQFLEEVVRMFIPPHRSLINDVHDDKIVGMGFYWERYGAATDVRRFADQSIFAYRKPERVGSLKRLFRIRQTREPG
jgi:hypothetical protein